MMASLLSPRQWPVVGLAVLGWMAVTLSNPAQTTATTNATESMRVGVNSFPPFVFVKSDSEVPVGYSIDLWQQIAQDLEQDYEFVVYESVQDVLDAVVAGEVDAGIAGITITAQRESVVDFSHPYYDSGLQILVLASSGNLIASLFTYLFAWETLEAAGIVFGTAIVAAHALWFFERRINPDMFPKTYPAGVWEAFWWSLVTATTVGYGDKCPKGTVGRVIAIGWMLGGILVFAHFTASITADRLQTRINGLEDLHGKRIATVVDTTAEKFLRRQPVELVEFADADAAYQALREGKVRAVVSDAPTLRYQAAQSTDLRVVGSLFAKQKYAIALPQGSPQRETINRILLELHEAGVLTALEQRWFLSGE